MTKTAPRPSPSLAQIERKSTKSFALALGGGGARGLAHVAVIEALDDMGIKPVAIAGTSIGALIGACYAAGIPFFRRGVAGDILFTSVMFLVPVILHAIAEASNKSGDHIAAA